MSDFFDDIMAGLQEAVSFEKGGDEAYVTVMTKTEDGTVVRSRQLITPLREYDKDEIRKIRLNSGLTQKLFARCMGVSKKTVESWEYGTNRPNGPARRLLALMEHGEKIIA